FRPILMRWSFFCEKSLQQKQYRVLFFLEYTSQLLLIFSPFTKFLSKWLWWQLLPSSLFGNVKSGLVWYGPLQTNSVSVLTGSQRAGQSAGSVGSPWISGIAEGEVSAGGSVVSLVPSVLDVVLDVPSPSPVFKHIV